MAWSDLVWSGVVWCGVVWFGLIWFGLSIVFSSDLPLAAHRERLWHSWRDHRIREVEVVSFHVDDDSRDGVGGGMGHCGRERMAQLNRLMARSHGYAEWPRRTQL